MWKDSQSESVGEKISMFELIPYGTKFHFMKYRYILVTLSLVVTIASFAIMATKGFKFGVDFAGGVEIILGIPKESKVDAERLRSALAKAGIPDASVQTFGGDQTRPLDEYIVHFPANFSEEGLIEGNLAKSFKAFQKTPDQPVVSKFRFSGLERAYLTLNHDVAFNDLKKAVEATSFGILELTDFQPFGRDSSREYQLSFKSIQTKLQTDLNKDLATDASKGVEIQKVDFVGAKVGADLKVAALLSILITTLLIFIYIFLRFDIVYAPGVVLSMIHDVSLTAGVFAWFGMEFDLTTVAALLTLAGYSINDTIIVYDRIREVAGSMKGKAFSEIIDIAINQTLGRTIITSGTVFLATLALYLWGGPVINGFAFAFLIGVIVGTYSSVFVAAPVILWMEQWWKGREVNRRKAAAA